MDIIKLIEEIQKLIFDFDIKTGMQRFELFTEELIRISEKFDPSVLSDLMNIINVINSSLTHKDYLLFNDLLEYELTPFLNKYVN